MKAVYIVDSKIVLIGKGDNHLVKWTTPWTEIMVFVQSRVNLINISPKIVNFSKVSHGMEATKYGHVNQKITIKLHFLFWWLSKNIFYKSKWMKHSRPQNNKATQHCFQIYEYPKGEDLIIYPKSCSKWCTHMAQNGELGTCHCTKALATCHSLSAPLITMNQTEYWEFGN